MATPFRMPLTLALLAITQVTAAALSAELRPPSVPLVACDPYFSIWSSADRLTDAETVHWTGKPHRLTATIEVDGQLLRLMGTQPADASPIKQKSLRVLPTRTIYEFEGGGIGLTLTFLTPALAHNLEVLSWPVTYVSWDVKSLDGASHAVRLEFMASGELAVNQPRELVDAKIVGMDDLTVAQIGSTTQNVLGKKGDDIRIDWGYLHVAVPQNPTGIAMAIDSTGGELPASGGDVAARVTFDSFQTGEQPTTCWLMLAYDDLYSIQYMKHNLRPYWRRNGWEARDLLLAAEAQYDSLVKQCEEFDRELMQDLTAAGGANYAALCALAYRQCFAAGKFVADAHGQPLQFCKENHSNGCIGTSDVFYPMAPQFLLFGPTLAKSFIVPFMNYAASERWRFPFAPHDLGQYPHANGQRYGGGERSEENQMPVEESGNLLILFAAVAEMEGHAQFAELYWPQLEQWAEYLKAKGFDPENQLCTDDFAGHLAHNVNLSAKAICGLAAFGKLCRMRGKLQQAVEYEALAKRFAGQWADAARDGDHYRLAFDRPGTWSQKYNLVWDRILGFDLFPAGVKETEMAYYREVQQPYGLPLDNRQTYTKLDWILWTATLTQKREDFEALVNPVVRFLNETPDRVPMTDWYFTDTGQRRGFTARPVVGGVFLQMLYDKDIWQKYTRRERTKAAGWASMPQPPRTETLLPTSEQQAATWRYTTQRPARAWHEAYFDDSQWQQGPAGFGTRGTPGTVVRTVWDTPQIWLRRTFAWDRKLPDSLALRIHHDEDVEVYINGIEVFRGSGFTTEYETVLLNDQVLRNGRNVIAAHCRQTSGGQYIDVGIDYVVE